MKPNYFVIPIIVFLTATIGSYFTGAGQDWYQTINLPSFTPPGWIIGLVWTFIFILSTMSVLIFWNLPIKKSDDKQMKIRFWTVILIFLINAGLNIFWSYLFFYQGLIGAAAFEAVLLSISVIALVVLIWPISRISSLLLVPYAIWVCFATFLNTFIWFLNY